MQVSFDLRRIPFDNPSPYVLSNKKYFSETPTVSFKDAYAEVDGWLTQISLKTGCCSTLLKCQMAELYRWEILGIDAIYDLISRLETKPERNTSRSSSIFSRRGILNGLKKHHFFDPAFIPKNLENYLISKEGSQYLNTFFAHHSGRRMGDVAGELVHGLTVDAFFKKRQDNSLTGEWLVYAQIGGKKFYLTLATHKLPKETKRLLPEFRHQTDYAILFNVCICAEEFAELTQLPLFAQD